jgi:hypothetical protein
MNNPTTRPHSPAHGSEYGAGMTIREYYAGQILSGLVNLRPETMSLVAADAVKWADALIAALNIQQPEPKASH